MPPACGLGSQRGLSAATAAGSAEGLRPGGEFQSSARLVLASVPSARHVQFPFHEGEQVQGEFLGLILLFPNLGPIRAG